MSGKGSVAASAIGRRGCGKARTYSSPDENKSGSWQEIKQKSTAYRWYHGGLRSRSGWLVLRNVETTVQTGVTGASYSGKIDRCLTLPKLERRKSQCLLC